MVIELREGLRPIDVLLMFCSSGQRSVSQWSNVKKGFRSLSFVCLPRNFHMSDTDWSKWWHIDFKSTRSKGKATMFTFVNIVKLIILRMVYYSAFIFYILIPLGVNTNHYVITYSSQGKWLRLHGSLL